MAWGGLQLGFVPFSLRRQPEKRLTLHEQGNKRNCNDKKGYGFKTQIVKKQKSFYEPSPLWPGYNSP